MMHGPMKVKHSVTLCTLWMLQFAVLPNLFQVYWR